MPGASLGIVLGIGLISFVFLPLLFLLKIKEQKETKNKVLIGLGTFAGILMTLGILFKIMFWPGANMMALTSLLILLFVFLPVYFFTVFATVHHTADVSFSSFLFICARTVTGLFSQDFYKHSSEIEMLF